MSMFSDLVNLFAKTTGVGDLYTGMAIEEMLGRIRAEEEIRFYVANSSNYGHQATTVNLMRRVIDSSGFAGSVLVAYEGGQSVLSRLALLLPGLDPRPGHTAPIQYGKCRIRLIEYDNRGNLPHCRFGFTGGVDLAANYADGLNVRYFLLLQPYLWEVFGHGETCVVQQPEAEGPTFNLTHQSSRFKSLAYKFMRAGVVDVANEIWNWYANMQEFDRELAIRTRNVFAIYNAYHGNEANWSLWPVYGLHQFVELSTNIVVNQVLAAFDVQSVRRNPFVILHFTAPNRMSEENDPWVFVKALALDINSRARELPALREAIARSARHTIPRLDELMLGLSLYLQPMIDRSSRLRLVEDWDPRNGYQDVSAEIAARLEQAGRNEIIVISIGPVPQDVYNYFFANANIPGVFEGQGTSSLLISLGRPFMQLTRPEVGGRSNYPTTLTAENYSVEAEYCEKRVRWLRELSFKWYLNDDGQMPVDGYAFWLRGISSFILQATSPANVLNEYFVGLGDYYQENIHDKLMVGLVGVYNVLLGGDVASLNLNAGPLTLQQVYDQLLAAWTDGSIDLLSALPNTYLSEFFGEVTGNKFSVVVDKQAIVADREKGNIVKVTVAGASTRSFLGVDMKIGLVFTAEYGTVVTEVAANADDTWTIDGIPWILLKDPGFEMRVYEGRFPVQGGIVGTVQSGNTAIRLMIEYPVADNTWLITATLEPPYPGINTIFAAAGGINLVQVLPPPLSTLAGFGLEQIQLQYNAAAMSFDYMSFRMTTDNPWTISQQPLFSVTPTVQVTVYDVADLAKRKIAMQVTGAFTIGSGTIGITGTYPDFQVYGGLADGQIELSDLLALFGGKLDLDTSVTAFNFAYVPAQQYYTIGALLQPDKPLVIGSFGIDSLSFNVSSTGSTNTFYLGGQFTVLPETANIGLSVVAEYATGAGWTFSGQQLSGTLKIGDLLTHYINSLWAPPEQYNYGIEGVSFTINTHTAYWEFGSRTAGAWEIPFLNMQVQGEMQIGYGIKGPGQGVGTYGHVLANIRWFGIDLTAFYDFAPGYKAFGVNWGALSGKVFVDDKGHQVANLVFTESVTLGSIVEEMISWATGMRFGLGAPWNVLNSIALNHLSLQYDFTAGSVSFQVYFGPIDLRFATINGIGISYNNSDTDANKNGVMVTLDVSSSWVTIPSWDATKPENTPAPPGQGNQYLDLRLLALGQHVTLDCFKTAATVQAVIECMKNGLPDTQPGELPGVRLDSNSSWLVGMDFGVLRLSGDKLAAVADDAAQYFLTMQIVFNDPTIYALRVVLEGEPAKIFKGLDFQIMYRKISDSVGVYQAEIALPDVMRHINMGQFNITLPVFAIAVYTNGDFQVDIGFPWNADFSRSFTFSTLIWTPIGIPIPVMGSAGVYFGKLSSATTNKVPVTRLGTFNPVLIFGFGMQFGFGYSFSAGILSAGFSLTAVAILEGVLAKFNPYLPAAGQTDDQLETSYYFWFRGTIGIIGQLYGSVDFAIVKAELNVDIRIIAQLTFAPYEILEVSLTVSVTVSLTITINLGLFKIHISFSFSTRIQQGISVDGIGGTPPWGKPGRLAALRRRERLHYTRQALLAAYGAVHPVWTNLEPAATPKPLTGYAAFGLTAAGDQAQQPADQLACYVAMLFLESVPPPQEDRVNGVAKAYADANDTSFELLSKQVLRWAIAAIQNGPIDSEQVDELIITDLQLGALLDWLADPANPVPIPGDQIDRFMSGQFVLTVQAPVSGEVHGTYFPVPPAMVLTLPGYGGGYRGLSYSFAAYNSTDAGYTRFLRDYFNELAMQEPADSVVTRVFDEPTGVSLGSFVFGDYFVLLCRQMLQATRDSLKDLKYYFAGTEKVSDILSRIHANAGDNFYTAEDLFTDNARVALNAGKSLRIAGSVYVVQAGDTFESIAGLAVFHGGYDSKTLAKTNAAVGNTLQAGIAVHYPGKEPYITQPGQSLARVAEAIGVSVDDLIDRSDVARLERLLLPVAALTVPVFDTITAGGDTLEKIAAAYGLTQQQLAAPAINLTMAGLFDSSQQPYLSIANLQQYKVGELIKEIQATGGLQHLSGMASRYYLSGLRLPTNGITPAYKGMWVTESGGKLVLPADAGLFALTGQQFPLPVLNNKDSFSLLFSRPAALSWLRFAGANPSMLTIPIAPGSFSAAQIAAVSGYATKQVADIELLSLGARDAFTSKAASYPFTSHIAWNSAAPIPMPYGGQAPGVPALGLWPLPDTLLELPDPAVRQVDPRVRIVYGRYDEPSRTMEDVPVNYYGYGTLVAFTVKRIPMAAGLASQFTYEVMGADGSNAELLERIVSGIGDDDGAIDLVTLAYAPDANGTTPQGIQTDAPESLTIGIAQVNLSTETRPDTAVARASDRRGTELRRQVLLNKPTELVRLLWQAGITRGGGYYLFYYNSDSQGGLPDRIFDDKGEAILNLLLLYTAPSDVSLQNSVTSYMTLLATGEHIDTTNAVLYAEADPILRSESTSGGQTLAGLAQGYFGNVADVAADNRDLVLRSGLRLQVAQGVYAVRPENRAPGGRLAEIASWFGTTVNALKAANPMQKQWPDPLPLYTPLLLPVLTVTVGGSTGGSTLDQLAGYYGEDLTALAADNADVPGIFADGQLISLRGGPDLRVATVAPGVMGVGAERTVPDAIPVDPGEKDYGRLFLLNTYNLLAYRVAENNYFLASNAGLPASPAGEEEDASNHDKVRYPRALQPGDVWKYSRSIPFSGFVRSESSEIYGMPSPGDSPYRGLGSLLQVEFAWQDLYGNRLLTSLQQPRGTSVLNRPPVLTGYTDALIGLNQWPSVSAAWLVDKAENGDPGGPQLQLRLSFSDNAYQGLLQALADTATSILCRFTEKLDPDTAGSPENYRIEPQIAILRVTLGGDSRSVLLEVDTLPQHVLITVSINGISSADKRQQFTGNAQFSYPDDPKQSGSSIVTQAARDLAVYTRLWYQLTDPYGIGYDVAASLLQGGFPLSADQVNELLGDWIRPIYLFIEDRSKGLMAIPAPAAEHVLSFAIEPSQLNLSQIFRLEVSFSIRRLGKAVAGEAATTGGILQTTTAVPALMNDGAGQTYSLDEFAQRFEAALLQPGKFTLKVATGPDRNAAGNSREIWAVRLGLDGLSSIGYSITDKGNPDLFAPRPISNQLETRQQVPVYYFSAKGGIDWAKPSDHLDFLSVDMDGWGRQLFAGIDGILSPAYTAAIQLVDQKKGAAYLSGMLESKKQLAEIVKEWMWPLFEDEQADATAAREAYKQLLLQKLGNAYTVQAALQYRAKVSADPEDGIAPRLYGNINRNFRFVQVTVDPADGRKLWLDLTNPPDPIAAGLPGNFNVSGLVVVASRVDPENTRRVELTLNEPAVAGTTTVAVAPGFADLNGQLLLPPLSRIVTTQEIAINSSDSITLTSPKLSLETSEGSVLPFLLTSPAIVRGTDNAILPYVDLDLGFAGVAIEHQIGSLPNIAGYEASSWLSFVAPPGADGPLQADLGSVQVPMVLREFPASPGLVKQAGPSVPPPEKQDISALLGWNYVIDYTMPIHYPQDELFFTVNFNVLDIGMTGDVRDAFPQLAEFVTVGPAVYNVLTAGLIQITAATPDDDPLLDTLSTALRSWNELVDHVVQSAKGIGLVMVIRPDTHTSNGAAPYPFVLSEGVAAIDGVQALIVKIKGLPPDGVGLPLVDIAGYERVVYAGGCGGDCCYYYMANGSPLPAAQGQVIAGRKVTLPAMNILARQDAATGVLVKRNALLIPDKPCNDVFVYTTGTVRFPNACHPTTDWPDPIDLSTIGAPAGQHNYASLEVQLTHLFDALLKENTQEELSFLMSSQYSYAINSSVDAIELPVMMQPLQRIRVKASGGGGSVAEGIKPLAEMIADWAGSITLWRNATGVSTEAAELRLDLTIFSHLTQQPLPLLRLRELYLPVEYIVN